ncbi:MAG: ABC-2 family transporter protein [Anaerolineales bacterium]|nr:ABC-2 family transporter protein [Anaerolineales bacterium]
MLKRELTFLFALWRANLQGAMEFRVSFLLQIFGMVANNLLYFAFWPVFFSHFDDIHGWTLNDMLIVMAIVSFSWGIMTFLFGNFNFISEVIANGRLDYYLSLPRPVLTHLLASRSNVSGLGDIAFGVVAYLLSGQFQPEQILRLLFGVCISGTILLFFMTLVHSLTFWVGNATELGNLGVNALLTFSLYPITIFDNTARFFLIIFVPALLVGSVPAQFVKAFSWQGLVQLSLGALVLTALAITVFTRGLRRYESGSAIQVEV